MRINLRPRILTGLEEKVLRMRYGLRGLPTTQLDTAAKDPQAALQLLRLERRLQSELLKGGRIKSS